MIKENWNTYSKMATSRHSTEDRNKVETNLTKSSRHHNSQHTEDDSVIRKLTVVNTSNQLHHVINLEMMTFVLNCKKHEETNHLTSTPAVQKQKGLLNTVMWRASSVRSENLPLGGITFI